MVQLSSARSDANTKYALTYGEVAGHDGVRRVVTMTHTSKTDENGNALLWQIDVGESMSDEHARWIAEAMDKDNGGGWEFLSISDRYSYEAQDTP